MGWRSGEAQDRGKEERGEDGYRGGRGGEAAKGDENSLSSVC